MYKFVIVNNSDENAVNDFVKLQKKIYDQNFVPSSSEVTEILKRTHPLSSYYEMQAFLVYKDNEVAGRCAVFMYPNVTEAYLGLYECIDDDQCSAMLFNEVHRYIKDLQYTKLVGPIDSSFYVKYRLKISGFDNPTYFAEPYNKEYYYKQFLNSNYQVKYRYTSKYLEDFADERVSTMINKRYDLCLKKGYTFKSLSEVNYDQTLKQIYELFINTFKALPIFHEISFSEFEQLFKHFRYIANRKQVMLAYYEDELVAFAINVPDYQNKLLNLNHLKNVLSSLKTRFFNTGYIGLYFACKPGHYYTSKAITKRVYDTLKPNSVIIAALMKSDTGTTNHYKDNYVLHSEYVLLSIDL